jgi:hypothetical protein
VNTTLELRTRIAELRLSAATCLASKDYDVRERAAGYLKMVEVTKVQLLARGEDVVVTSRTGSKWVRK